MNSWKTCVILALAAALLGGSVLAWRQYQELVQLRASLLSPDERASLRKELTSAQQRIRTLKERVARLTPTNNAKGAVADDDPKATAEERAAARRERQAQNQARFKAVQAMMATPEFQGLQAVVQKGQLDARYGALFKSLNLNPAQLDQLKTLLLDKQNAFMDVRTAMAGQGVDPQSDPKGFSQAMSSAINDVNDQIKAALGDAGYAQLQQFDRTGSQRATVGQLTQSLSYSSTPLSDQQASQLVDILAQNPVPRVANPSSSTTMVNGTFVTVGNGGPPIQIPGGGFMPGVSISPQALTLAAGVLTGSQLQALQQMQQDQQSAQQLSAAIQQQVQQARQKNPPTAAPARAGGG